MGDIKADIKTVRELLDKKKYQIDIFQREYKWEKRHIEQLISDLENKFFSEYTKGDSRECVQSYARYYMGTIIISTKNEKQFIIDGQQRLTSITLLLIYLKNLQYDPMHDSSQVVEIGTMIFSTTFSKRSHNLDIPDRKDCMDALYSSKKFDPTNEGESVKNIMQVHEDIKILFPDELKRELLPYFIDWLIERVMFVNIMTTSDDDAYAIFETVNNRGLGLTSTELLKGYLLSKRYTGDKESELNKIWKDTITKLKEISKEEDSEFFKSWLRGKYAESIRENKKNAENKDFEKIATQFHNWVSKNEESKLHLKEERDFYEFIKQDFVFYGKQYIKINNAANKFNEKFEYVYYIKELGVAPSFYYPMLIASISRDDDEVIINKKINLVARFLEIFYICRIVNYRTTLYNSIRNTIFNITKQIRNQDLDKLVLILKEEIEKPEYKLDGISKYEMKTNRKKHARYLLARIASHIDKNSKVDSSFDDYMSNKISNPFTIEHLWADKIEYHPNTFLNNQEFEEWRNKLGALVLVPKDFNQSYGANKYENKLIHYNTQNLLTRSLHHQCYDKNPSFVQYKDKSNLPFKPYKEFKKKQIIERQNLYQKICEEIWHVSGFDRIASSS